MSEGRPKNSAVQAERSARRRRLLAGLLAAPTAYAVPAFFARGAGAAELPAIVAAAKPSIVAIGAHAPLQNPRFRFLGSGFVVADGRRAVTCAHVIPVVDPEKRESIAVAIPGSDGTRVLAAKAETIDRDTDLAVLSFDGPGLPALELAEPGEIREGAEVLLMGFPIGSALGLFAATHRGIIAAVTPMIIPAAGSAGLRAQNLQVLRGKPIQLLQLDATAYPGNSGGPLIDSSTGRVVGVMSFGLAKGSRESAIQYPTGISYAIPSRYVRALLDQRKGQGPPS